MLPDRSHSLCWCANEYTSTLGVVVPFVAIRASASDGHTTAWSPEAWMNAPAAEPLNRASEYRAITVAACWP